MSKRYSGHVYSYIKFLAPASYRPTLSICMHNKAPMVCSIAKCRTLVLYSTSARYITTPLPVFLLSGNSDRPRSFLYSGPSVTDLGHTQYTLLSPPVVMYMHAPRRRKKKVNSLVYMRGIYNGPCDWVTVRAMCFVRGGDTTPLLVSDNPPFPWRPTITI